MTISATTQGLRPGVCTSTSRPSSPFDGQLIYETDTNRVAVYDTNAWVYKTPASTTGSVLQVASTTKTDTYTGNNSTFTTITGLTVSITPLFTTSKIFVIASVAGGVDTTASTGHLRLLRDATAIAVGASPSSRVAGTAMMQSNNGTSQGSYILTTLDSPSTTSSITYAVQETRSNQSATVSINRSLADTDNAQHARTTSTITAIEVAG